MRTQDIRSAFLAYFKNNAHTIVPSEGLIPSHDPTLLFTNAGMVPFKNYFTGQEKSPYATAASVQKCLRAGGKHNDLDNVGYTARHHTFFEMMGNFSFGDYFKEKAILYAWTFLTKELALNPNNLYITHFSEDLEARTLWKKISGFSDDKILPISTQDNFWSMGPTGPCGPCSEIFYDHGSSIKGGLPGTPDEDGDRYVEIWNLVFMQFDQLSETERVSLPKPCIDTGMGLERIAAVMQGTHDNFETDIFKSLIEVSADLTQTHPQGPHGLSHRVIADHLRSSAFLIAEGLLPGNEGRGYVLRRILRRALRYVHLTGYSGILLPKLVPSLVSLMGEAYPELNRAQSLIEKTLQDEEEKFQKTLSRGLSLLEEELSQLGGKTIFPGKAAFKLYDTYGFPLDMTQDALKSKGITVNTKEFDEEMTQQKELARKNWKGSGDEVESPLYLSLVEKHGPTHFLGYTHNEAEGTLLALVVNQTPVETLAEGETGIMILDQTPFYAESGGQVGDTGIGMGTPDLSFTIQDTQKNSRGLFFHKVVVQSGTLSVGQSVLLKVDQEHRRAVRANHSATHLLHSALKRRFGESVVQKGSLVKPDKLRFDFTLSHSLTPEDIHFLERSVNQICRQNLPAQTQLQPLEKALESGAVALFGEKYEDNVRVVSIGIQDEEETASIELCGGTHVSATGEIGLFKIITQSSIAAGIRRIEAITGAATEAYLTDLSTLIDDLAKKLRVPTNQAPHKIDELLIELKDLKKKLEKAQNTPTASLGDKKIATFGEVSLITLQHTDFPAKQLRPLMDQLKKTYEKNSIILIFNIEKETEKLSLLLGVTSDLTSTFKANELIPSLAIALEGKGGGGRPDLAQCGGQDKKNIPKCIKIVEKLIINK